MPKRISKSKRQQLKIIRSYERYVAGSPEMQALIADDAQEREITEPAIGELIVELSEFARNWCKK
jgi:hypothetical protein